MTSAYYSLPLIICGAHMSEFDEYVQAGWKLCAIERGQKRPWYKGWNSKPIPDDAVGGLEGAGLLHALSGTCALDIDDIELARPWLAERGVDLDALLSDPYAVRIDSGRPGRAKLLYTMRRPLRTFKPKDSGVEFRCATTAGTSTQDVLPPTIHPVTKKPYEWLYAEPLIGDWRSLPPIPASLLGAWRALIAGGDEESEPVKVEASDKSKPVDITKLKKAAFTHDPNCEYDKWIKVGMQLHDGTGGAQEGFDIWAEWSQGITRAVYPGDSILKSHWLSFGSGSGKRVVSGEALAAELPAEAEDFEIQEPNQEPAKPDPKTEERKAHLEKLIERFVFVTWEQEYFDRERNVLIGDKAIRHLLTPYMPRKNGREVDPVERLMRSRHKDAVEAMAFHPGEDSIFTYNKRRYANTFHDRSPEPLEPTSDDLEKIAWLFGRIDDEMYRGWLLQFYAHMVQRPGIKIRTAPLIWSKIQGNGKSTIVGTIPKLLVGEDYYTEVTQGELNSNHNDFLIGKWHITLAEFRAGTRGEREAISKKVENWIADDTLAIHPKGTKGYSVPNHLVVTASTNKDDAALIDEHDRKWAVHELKAPAMTHAEKEWLFTKFLRAARGPAVMRHYFLNYPITDFDPNADAPRTASREHMIESSTSPDLEMLITAFEERSEPLSKDVVLTREVGDYVRRYCMTKPSNNRIGKLLAGEPFNGIPKKICVGPKTRQAWYRAIVLRDHDRWVEATGTEVMAHINGEDEALDPLAQ
jgi:hypothetical protein